MSTSLDGLDKIIEEAVKYRMAEEIKRHNEEVAELRKQLKEVKVDNEKLREDRVYLKFTEAWWGRHTSTPAKYEYIEIDELTKDLKETKEKLKEATYKSKTYETRLGVKKEEYEELKKGFNKLPWYDKMFFNFKETK